MKKRKKLLLPLMVGLLLPAFSCPAAAEGRVPVASASNAKEAESGTVSEERGSRKMSDKAAAKSQEEGIGVIRDLRLNIISPEEETVLAGELPSSIRIFIFGDLGNCGNTKGVMQQLGKQLQGMDVSIYYLDIKNNDAATIIRGARESQAEGIGYLCEDKDKSYARAAAKLIQKSSYTMPAIFVAGKEDETLYADSSSGTPASVVGNIKKRSLTSTRRKKPG